ADPRSMDRSSSISKYNRIDTNRMTNMGQNIGLNFTNAVPFYTPRPAQSATARSPNQPGISYICSDCGKEFKQHRLLLRHKKIHTGEKPFTCLDCGSTFRLSSELLTHRRKHTGERPYACPDCDKCFKHNRNLKTHLHIQIYPQE
uniref:C2H2-type domain-containing protein n=1 Tax=Leptobrachium leishanense TaxID=445787 RepID=A0A8C5M699_9ANUR